MNNKLIGGSVVGGVVITLISGLVNSTPSGLVGAAWYGWPLAWMYNLVTHPPATTFGYTNLVAWMYNLVTHPPATTFGYTNLVVDIVIWFVVSLIVLFAIGRMKGGKKA